MNVIGLTGGSGTGKSAAAKQFCRLGAGWVDADAVYHKLCAKNTAMLTELKTAFGDIVTPDGELNRRKLAEIVFSDATRLRQLNTITLPYIRAASLREIRRQAEKSIVLFDAPTLFETGMNQICDKTIGILAEREIRIARVMSRDNVTEQAAAARIDAQPDDLFYQERCDFILTNNNTIDALQADIIALYSKL